MLIQIVGQRWAVTTADPKFKDGVVCLGLKDQMKSIDLKSLATLI